MYIYVYASLCVYTQNHEITEITENHEIAKSVFSHYGHYR